MVGKEEKALSLVLLLVGSPSTRMPLYPCSCSFQSPASLGAPKPTAVNSHSRVQPASQRIRHWDVSRRPSPSRILDSNIPFVSPSACVASPSCSYCYFVISIFIITFFFFFNLPNICLPDLLSKQILSVKRISNVSLFSWIF